jgi:hypothetical protein
MKRASYNNIGSIELVNIHVGAQSDQPGECTGTKECCPRSSQMLYWKGLVVARISKLM